MIDFIIARIDVIIHNIKKNIGDKDYIKKAEAVILLKKAIELLEELKKD